MTPGGPTRRWLVFLSAAVLTVLALVLAPAAASAQAAPAAGTRVGASPAGMILTVGVPERVSPGQRQGRPAPQAPFAAGAVVAAEDGSDLADAAATCGGESFTAGTKVLLASGTAIPISQLKAGDKVLATNTRTGKTRAEPVAAVLVHHDTDRYDLTIKSGRGTAVIQTTSSHLFWDIASHRWVKAAALRYGSHLRAPSGANVTVLGGHVPAHADGWMWDLSVPGGGDHDFYIDVATIFVLVHNCELPGYSSFRAAKADLGSPGTGNVFDHVVEQSQIGRSGFTSEAVNNPFNLDPVPGEVNQLKANYYSSKQIFTEGGTVRDWLTGQSFTDQYEFGMDVLMRIQNGLPLP